MPRRIVLTGGGSAGHVTRSLALLGPLRAAGWEVHYIGSAHGIERELVAQAGLPFHAVQSGKLRRYWSWQNLSDPLRVVAGVAQAYALLSKLRPDVVLSKGGFVAVPVVLAAWLARIPIVVHESDRSPGLANRISFPFATRICTAHEETLARLSRAVCTGSPVRPELLSGDRARAERRFNLDPTRSLLLVIGGSLGAQAINRVVFALARELPNDLQILHVCGRGNLDPTLQGTPHYHAYEYLQEELADALARADVVVSRAGASSLAELTALRKPALLVPLPAAVSRGDQLENARLHAERGYGLVMPQSDLTLRSLTEAVRRLINEAATFCAKMDRSAASDASLALLAQLEAAVAASREPER